MTVGTRDVLDAALYYAQRGWPVVPIIAGAKRPNLDAWVERATTDADLIGQWWSAHPGDGVGIVCGARAGLFALDVDPAHGGDDTLDDLEHEHGELGDTIEAVTGGGGRHVLFAWPGFNPGTNAGILGPGLDIRAEGGMIVAPPTVHPNGRAYAWDVLHDPRDGVALADAPSWLLSMLAAVERVEPLRRVPVPHTGESRPGDRFNEATTWADMLTADGATCMARRHRRDGDGYELWVRPGKSPRGGASASLYYGGSDVLKVFTTNWPGLTEGATYTRFGYFAATRYGGDHRAAASALAAVEPDKVAAWFATLPVAPSPRSAGPITAAEILDALDAPEPPVRVIVVEPDAVPLDDGLPIPIDWATFADRDRVGNDWLCEPLLPAGRQVAIYAPAKLGKSLFVFDVAVALATGAAVLRQAAGDPIDVSYFDFEMTLDDVDERLLALEAAPATLARLHYYSLPTLGPLDVAAGAATLVACAVRDHARLVIIDTMARAVQGEENSADTYRAFYRLVGMPLKARGITLARIDHAGKDATKGQRGSSEKAGDVDVVWRMQAAGRDMFEMVATHRRLGWVPDRFAITRHDDPLRHVLTDADTFPLGTAEIVATLDALGVPLDATVETARVAIAAASPDGRGKRKQNVAAAMRMRLTTRGTVTGTAPSQDSEPLAELTGLTGSGTVREPPEPTSPTKAAVPPPIGGNRRGPIPIDPSELL